MGPEDIILISVYVLAGLLGLCVGSFLNVVIYRTPNGMNLAKPDSHCTRCGYVLKWYDNIPVLSYIMLGGKCRKCKEKISPRYMLVEILNAVLWVLCVFLFWEHNIGYAVVSALVLSTLVCIFFIDLEHLLIFNRFVIILFGLAIALIVFDRYAGFGNHLIGMFVGGLFFLAMYFGSLLILKKEGMGFGDVKLAFAAGFLLGWQRFIFALVIASVAASIVLLIVRRVRHDENDHEYPFGPFLSVGIAAAMLCGEPVIEAYLGLLKF